jgi:hypothetical protein
LDNQGTPGTHANVGYAAALDAREPVIGRDPNIRFVALLGGQQQQVPIEDLVSVTRGSHSIELRASVGYSSYEGGDVIVGPVTLVAVLLP